MFEARPFLLLLLLVYLVGCSKKIEIDGSNVMHKREIKILSYSSFNGPGSLGESIQLEFNKKCGDNCEVSIDEAKDFSGLLGTLLQKNDYDVVIGLDQFDLHMLKKKKLVSDSFQFAESAFSINVNSKLIPRNKAPKSWSELIKKYPNSVLIQDPRLSTVGKGWLRSVKEHQLLSLSDSKKLVLKVFPSWSSAYSTFTKGEAPMVWSYASSESYHLCEEKSEQFYALELVEGYPVQEEWIAFLKTKSQLPPKLLALFKKYLLSDSVQKQVAVKNWMKPVKNINLRECFKKSFRIKGIRTVSLELPFLDWLDEWSVQ